MIIKHREATPRTIERLERRAQGTADAVLAAACRGAAARLRASRTTERACAFIDARFADTSDWAVLHDLRLDIGGHAVHLDHVLIGRALQVICVDTRFIDAGLRLGADGRCESFDGRRRRLIASPLAAMARDVRKLGAELGRIGMPGTRLGLGPRPALRGCVLSDPSHRLDIATGYVNGDVGVFPRDALYPMLWKRERRGARLPYGRLSADALADFATRLAGRHRPCFASSLLGEDRTRVSERTAALIAAEF